LEPHRVPRDVVAVPPGETADVPGHPPGKPPPGMHGQARSAWKSRPTRRRPPGRRGRTPAGSSLRSEARGRTLSHHLGPSPHPFPADTDVESHELDTSPVDRACRPTATPRGKPPAAGRRVILTQRAANCYVAFRQSSARRDRVGRWPTDALPYSALKLMAHLERPDSTCAEARSSTSGWTLRRSRRGCRRCLHMSSAAKSTSCPCSVSLAVQRSLASVIAGGVPS
jgi:hypothetical protein